MQASGSCVPGDFFIKLGGEGGCQGYSADATAATRAGCESACQGVAVCGAYTWITSGTCWMHFSSWAECNTATGRCGNNNWGNLGTNNPPNWQEIESPGNGKMCYRKLCPSGSLIPTNAGVGTCAVSQSAPALPVGSTCQPSCDAGFALSAPTTCTQNGIVIGSCNACADGSYCPANTMVGEELPCPAGYSCAPGTSDATRFDTPCEDRFFCNAGTSPATRRNGLCPAGFYCYVNVAGRGTEWGTQYPAPAGSYAESGSRMYTLCPAGTYV